MKGSLASSQGEAMAEAETLPTKDSNTIFFTLNEDINSSQFLVLIELALS